jgi:hypothetical protein
MVDGWDKAMAEARTNCGALKLASEKKVLALATIKMIDSAFDRLMSAQDQAAFDVEVNELMGAIFLGLGGASPPPGALPGPGVPPGLPGGVPSGKDAVPAPPK